MHKIDESNVSAKQRINTKLLYYPSANRNVEESKQLAGKMDEMQAIIPLLLTMKNESKKEKNLVLKDNLPFTFIILNAFKIF